MHQVSYPSILYFGTPVVLLSTVNDNGSFNLAPISSAFWLGWRCIIGISAFSKTTENLLRTKECVINLPSVNEVQAVNNLALTTGSNPVPTSLPSPHSHQTSSDPPAQWNAPFSWKHNSPPSTPSAKKSRSSAARS